MSPTAARGGLASPPTPTPAEIDRYVVVRPGEDPGHFDAYDTRLDREVRLECHRVVPGEHPFRTRHRSALVGVDHPCVAKIYDYGTYRDDEGAKWRFVSAEARRGTPLRQWLLRRPSARQIARVLHRLAGALRSLHGAGSFHGALELDTVVVHDGIPRLHEFGDHGDTDRDTRAFSALVSQAFALANRKVPRRTAALLRDNATPGLDAYETALRPTRKRNWWLSAALLSCVGVAGAWSLPSDAPIPEHCRAAALASWSPATQDTLRARLQQRRDDGGVTWERLGGRLSQYADDIADRRTQLCAHSPYLKEHHPEVWLRRDACLQRRQLAFDALVDLLARSEGDGFSTALGASWRLPDPDCNGLEMAALPDLWRGDPKLAAAQQLFELGRYADALEQAEALMSSSEEARVQAGAMVVKGRAQDRLGRHPEAAATLAEAAVACERTGALAEAVRAKTELVWVHGYRLHEPDHARAWATNAASLVAQLGDPPLLRAALMQAEGAAAYGAGKYDSARAAYDAALAVRREHLPAQHPELASTINNVGAMLYANGQPLEALKYYREAWAAMSTSLGDRHPMTVRFQQNMANVLHTIGEYEVALERYRSVFELLQESLGMRHPRIATNLLDQAGVLEDLGRLEEAESRIQKAVEIQREALPEDSGEHAVAAAALGHIELHKGEPAEALRWFRSAQAIWKRTLGAEHPRAQRAEIGIGRALLELGAHAEAAAQLEAAVATVDRVQATNHLNRATGHWAWGRALAGLGKRSAAIEHYKIALDLLRRTSQDPLLRSRVQAHLADALPPQDEAKRAHLAEAIATISRIGDHPAELAKWRAQLRELGPDARPVPRSPAEPRYRSPDPLRPPL